MIIAYRLHEVAARFIEVGPHDQSGGRDIVARSAQQSLSHDIHRLSGIPGKCRKPSRVNLHVAEINGTIMVDVLRLHLPTFDCVN